MNSEQIIESLKNIYAPTIIDLDYNRLFENPHFTHNRSFEYPEPCKAMYRVNISYSDEDIYIVFIIKPFKDHSKYFVYNKMIQEKNKDYGVSVFFKPIDHLYTSKLSEIIVCSKDIIVIKDHNNNFFDQTNVSARLKTPYQPKYITMSDDPYLIFSNENYRDLSISLSTLKSFVTINTTHLLDITLSDDELTLLQMKCE